MKKRIIIIAITAIILISASIYAICSRTQSTTPPLNITASLVSVLSRPDHFSEKNIFTEGVLFVDDNGCVSLYLSREHMENGITKNAIYIDKDSMSSDTLDELKDFTGKYVIARGYFDAQNSGPENLYSGTLIMESFELS